MDIDGFIAEIAKRNGVAMTRDDPVMVMATFHEILLRESAEAQKKLLDSFKKAMEQNNDQFTAHAMRRAQQILQEAVTAAREAAKGEAGRELSGLGATFAVELERIHSAQSRLQWLFVFNLLGLLLVAGLVVVRL
jgi:hypothetical protein